MAGFGTALWLYGNAAFRHKTVVNLRPIPPIKMEGRKTEKPQCRSAVTQSPVPQVPKTFGNQPTDQTH